MSDKEEKEKKEKTLKQKKLDYMIEMEKQEKEKDNSKDSDQDQQSETEEPKKDWRKDTVWENQQKEAEGSGELDQDGKAEEPPREEAAPTNCAVTGCNEPLLASEITTMSIFTPLNYVSLVPKLPHNDTNRTSPLEFLARRLLGR